MVELKEEKKDETILEIKEGKLKLEINLIETMPILVRGYLDQARFMYDKFLFMAEQERAKKQANTKIVQPKSKIIT